MKCNINKTNALLLLAVINIILSLSGCAYNGAIHREFDPVTGKLVRQDEFGQLLFCYFTDKKQVEFDLDKVASLYIGSSLQKSEPNSIEAAGTGIVKPVVEAAIGVGYN